jgi:hypothetical protein
MGGGGADGWGVLWMIGSWEYGGINGCMTREFGLTGQVILLYSICNFDLTKMAGVPQPHAQPQQPFSQILQQAHESYISPNVSFNGSPTQQPSNNMTCPVNPNSLVMHPFIPPYSQLPIIHSTPMYDSWACWSICEKGCWGWACGWGTPAILVKSKLQIEYNKEVTLAAPGLVYVCFGSFVKWSRVWAIAGKYLKVYYFYKFF